MIATGPRFELLKQTVPRKQEFKSNPAAGGWHLLFRQRTEPVDNLDKPPSRAFLKMSREPERRAGDVLRTKYP